MAALCAQDLPHFCAMLRPAPGGERSAAAGGARRAVAAPPVQSPYVAVGACSRSTTSFCECEPSQSPTIPSAPRWRRERRLGYAQKAMLQRVSSRFQAPSGLKPLSSEQGRRHRRRAWQGVRKKFGGVFPDEKKKKVGAGSRRFCFSRRFSYAGRVHELSPVLALQK